MQKQHLNARLLQRQVATEKMLIEGEK
ncbi:MAG: hypothetical protein ACI8RD_009833, partial [Bacillariaceae sp.]